MGRGLGGFRYDRARGAHEVYWPEGLREASETRGAVGVRLALAEPLTLAYLTFQTGDGAACPPPEGVTVARAVTAAERLRYPGTELPAEEAEEEAGGVFAVLPQHEYVVRSRGARVFSLHATLQHTLEDDVATPLS